ncbi:MAG TPA: hypothetical protein VNE61_07490 [Ktedonobacteraceae bacterium]|nr:hypothetical protein [Ktedonobacteraceae bacterium]
MAFNVQPQRAAAAQTVRRGSPELTAESLLPAVETARFAGNVSALSHAKAPKIVWPERYRQRYRLPANVEEQPF